MELIVEPAAGRVDVVPRVLVPGARGPVRLEIVTTDAAGHRWRSAGSYPLDADGALRFHDAERPWWDMAFADDGAVPVAFTAPDTDLRYQVTVTAQDGAGDSAATRNDALISGGSPQGVARAQRASWDAVLAFLGDALR